MLLLFVEVLFCLGFKAAYLPILLRLAITMLLLILRFQMVHCVHIQVNPGIVLPLLRQALLAGLVIDLGYAPVLMLAPVFAVIRLFRRMLLIEVMFEPFVGDVLIILIIITVSLPASS